MKKYQLLRQRMKALNLKARDLAEITGKSLSTIEQSMCGNRPWTQDEMYKVLRLIDEPPQRLYWFFPDGGIHNEADMPQRRKIVQDRNSFYSGHYGLVNR